MNIKLFFYPINRPLKSDELALVSSNRRLRAQAYHFPQDRARCLAAGWLLATYLGLDESDLCLGKNGKPYARAGHPYFNLSHAGNYVVLALAPREVGVDIEPVCAYDNAVAKHCFTMQEYEWVQQQGTNEAFFQLWTAKESVMKAVGKGLYLPPESFELLPTKGPSYLVSGKIWHLNHLQVNGHMVCTALYKEGAAIQTVYIES